VARADENWTSPYLAAATACCQRVRYASTGAVMVVGQVVANWVGGRQAPGQIHSLMVILPRDD
jgi:hypothetical protein